MGKTMKRRRATGEAREFRDQEWLRLHQEGKSTSAIAEAAGVSVQLVRRALARARELDASREQDVAALTTLQPRESEASEEGSPSRTAAPRTPWWLELVPLFPIGPLTPTSECPHRGPLETGSLLCCMVCSASGMDSHASMKRDPETDPQPEPSRPADPIVTQTTDAGPAVETRRQRRARKFADRRIRDDGPSNATPHTPR
ncbi:sigma-70 family RNA polymerase sigma factor [Paludisphaera rhizosphaerae]|uniref:sigma-70 family RNA polymerase sigma factor n=1 Tax=Paludisphaera rhizosphaerae TaxID=2711216 RepID=UPI0013EDE395|nr:sigma-70 family RNA polymerase sigma factor [Paludisphaera rhizosphaerae]